jgi:hypothetical protein
MQQKFYLLSEWPPPPVWRHFLVLRAETENTPPCLRHTIENSVLLHSMQPNVPVHNPNKPSLCVCEHEALQNSKRGVFISAAMSSASNGTHANFSRSTRVSPVTVMLFVMRNHVIWTSPLDKPKNSVFYYTVTFRRSLLSPPCTHIWQNIPHQRGVPNT